MAGSRVVPPFAIQPREQDLAPPGTQLVEAQRPGNAQFGFGPTLYDQPENLGFEPKAPRTDFPLDNGPRLPFKNLRGKR